MSRLETFLIPVSVSHGAASVHWLLGHTRIYCIYSAFTNRLETSGSKAGQHPERLLPVPYQRLTNPLVLIRRWPFLPCFVLVSPNLACRVLRQEEGNTTPTLPRHLSESNSFTFLVLSPFHLVDFSPCRTWVEVYYIYV